VEASHSPAGAEPNHLPGDKIVTLTENEIVTSRRTVPRSRLLATGVGIGIVAMTAGAVAGAGSAFADRLDAKGV